MNKNVDKKSQTDVSMLKEHCQGKRNQTKQQNKMQHKKIYVTKSRIHLRSSPNVRLILQTGRVNRVKELL